MAEDTNTAPPVETPKMEDKPKTESQDQTAWEKITEGKFKSPDELATSYKELEKKFGENSDEVAQARQLAQVVAPIMEVIRNDPALFKTIDERLKNESSATPTPPKTEAKGEENKEQSEEVKSILKVTSDSILSRFEERNGILALQKEDPEEARKLRQAIGDTIFELTGKSLNGVDLRRLETTLENAYIIVKNKSKSASPEAATEDRASFSSVPASAGKSETVLTSEEASVADKLGMSREQYLEGKKVLAKK